jgi:hypothetical protein
MMYKTMFTVKEKALHTALAEGGAFIPCVVQERAFYG